MSSKDSKKRKADLERFLLLLKEKRLEKEQKDREKSELIQKQQPISSEKPILVKQIKKVQKKIDLITIPTRTLSDEIAVLDAVVPPLASPSPPVKLTSPHSRPSSKNEYFSIVYIYDIFAKDKKSFNRTKRLFYYYLNKLPLSKNVWKTKSTIAVSPSLEKTMDSFFSRFGSRLIVYKICAQTIEQLE